MESAEYIKALESEMMSLQSKRIRTIISGKMYPTRQSSLQAIDINISDVGPIAFKKLVEDHVKNKTGVNYYVAKEYPRGWRKDKGNAEIYEVEVYTISNARLLDISLGNNWEIRKYNAHKASRCKEDEGFCRHYSLQKLSSTFQIRYYKECDCLIIRAQLWTFSPIHEDITDPEPFERLPSWQLHRNEIKERKKATKRKTTDSSTHIKSQKSKKSKVDDNQRKTRLEDPYSKKSSQWILY